MDTKKRQIANVDRGNFVVYVDGITFLTQGSLKISGPNKSRTSCLSSIAWLATNGH